MGFINFVVCTLVFFLFSPIFVLCHEFGHAIPALLFTKGAVSIDIGNSNLIKQIKRNRLTINLNGYKSPLDVTYGYVHCTQETSKMQSLLIYLGGPFMSLMISTLLCIVIINVSWPYTFMLFLRVLFLLNFVQFLSTILPIKYFWKPYLGTTSDGYKVLQQLWKK